jgi:hypothetical protein
MTNNHLGSGIDNLLLPAMEGNNDVPHPDRFWRGIISPNMSQSRTHMVREQERSEGFVGIPPNQDVNPQSLETHRNLGTATGGNDIAIASASAIARTTSPFRSFVTPTSIVDVHAIPLTYEGLEDPIRISIPDIRSTMNEDHEGWQRPVPYLLSSYQRRTLLEILDEAIAIASGGDEFPAAIAVTACNPGRMDLSLDEPDHDPEQ